jgi:hypothetical protein
MLLAVYLDEYLVTLPVPKDSKFIRYNPDLLEELKDYNYQIDKLFALSATQVLKYDLRDEKSFFKTLLADDKFSENNLFFRLSLAKATGEIELILKETARCTNHIKSTTPDFLDSWLQLQHSPS